MPNKKINTNWFYIFLGICFVLFYFLDGNANIRESDLVSKQIVASSDIKNIHYHKNREEYRIWTEEYVAGFVILTPGTMYGRTSELNKISAGDTLEVQIHKNRVSDLNNKSVDIPIYSLERNHKIIFSLLDYNLSQRDFTSRWKIIFLVLACIFLLRGFALISSRTSYVIGALAALGLIIINLFYNKPA